MKHFETDAGYDYFELGGGLVLKTHSSAVCGPTRYPCCIHKPSDHPLRDAPLNWREERKLMERVCAHGLWHPDPDDLSFKRRSMRPETYHNGAYGIHDCDGCCRFIIIDGEVVEMRKEIGPV